ncbi:hypothetical protein KY345_00810 [Candidatus Woesearchaeota archaeon]|nr:hypothetical protein [Candidatus Woesearchaeota archaeon]
MEKDRIKEAKLWQRTTTMAMVFLIIYGVMQYIIAGMIKPVSLVIGAIAFWLVFFIIGKAMEKHMEEK